MERTYRKWLHYVKPIFLISVIVLVLREILVISRQTDFSQLQQLLQKMPVTQSLILVAIGLLATATMIGYDFVLNKLLQTTYQKRYIIKSSWIINSFNNLMGFGGLIGSGLRSTFFSENDAEQKNVLKRVSSILIFALSGLSILAMISLGITSFMLNNHIASKYIIWLIAASLYFPIIYVMTLRSQWLKDLKLSIKLQLVSISILEWVMVLVTFLAVGKALGQDMSFLDVSVLFVVCSIIGIASLVPGGLGSFDVFMIISLRTLGVDNEVAVSWLLLYRIVYYFIPFALGMSLFAGNIGENLNARFNGIPKQMIAFSAKKLLSAMLFIAGIVLILSNTIPTNVFVKQSVLSSEFPSIIVGIVLGFLLLLLGRTSTLRLRKSFLPMCVVICMAGIYCIIEGYPWFMFVYIAFIMLLAILSRHSFSKLAFYYSWEARVFDLSLYAILIALYLLLGYFVMPHEELHKFEAHFYLFPSERLWFYGLCLILMTFAIELLFIRYLKGKPPVKHFDEARVKKLLMQYGGHVHSHLAFMRDKYLFFYQEDDEDVLLMQYELIVDKCIVMGDPIGKQSAIKAGLRALKSEMARRNIKLVFYEATESTVMQLHEIGFDFIKMGEEGHVSLDNFTMSGKKRKTLRATMNKLEREGYHFKLLSPPFADSLLDELEEISTEWLAGRHEKGYSVGSFDRYYLNKAPIGVVKREDGRIEAFVTLMPTQTKKIVSIDLMRYRKDTVSGMMDFLFISLFIEMQQQRYAYFNLGMAPFSEVGASKDSFIEERLAFFLYEYGNRFYSFKGLRTYKEKYADHWTSRYTVYSKQSMLLFVMIQLLIVVNRDKS